MGITEEDMEELSDAVVKTVKEVIIDTNKKLTHEELDSFKKFMKMVTAEFAVGLENAHAHAQK